MRSLKKYLQLLQKILNRTDKKHCPDNNPSYVPSCVLEVIFQSPLEANIMGVLVCEKTTPRKNGSQKKNHSVDPSSAFL